MKKINYPEYKGYHALIEYDSISMVLHGRIDGINDLVTFESDNSQDIISEFHSAVDSYLEFCAEVGKDPCKEYKGTFNVRISPELHRRIANYAISNDKSLNSCIEDAVSMFMDCVSIKDYITEEPIENELKYDSRGCSASESVIITPIA